MDGYRLGQFCLTQMGVCRLRLLGTQLQNVCPYGFLNEARQIAFPSTALAGQKHAKRLVGVG
jgi:hypothetical protein